MTVIQGYLSSVYSGMRLTLVDLLTGHWLLGPLHEVCPDVCTVF